MRRIAFILFVLAAQPACGPGYLPGTRIEATPDREAVALVVERYRLAMEQRDPDAIRKLVSSNYYENASTTENPNDDYDVVGLEKVLTDLKTVVKAVKYDIELTDVQVIEDVATVDFDYKSQYMYIIGAQENWQTASDRNRITLRREKGEWRIVSGL